MRRLALAAALIAASGAYAQDSGDEAAHPIFRWPVIGKIVKSSDGRGVDIVVPEGDAVHAAADGAVIYAGDQLKSFGEMIVIRHADGYATTYSYLSNLDVKSGDEVKRGEIIGKSGKTGDAPRPELHFELRKGETTLDAIKYMSPR